MHGIRGLERGLTALILVLLFGQANAFPGNSGNDFLPVEEAFQLDVEVVGEQVRAHWDIAPDYYLYQARIDLSGEGADLCRTVARTGDVAAGG